MTSRLADKKSKVVVVDPSGPVRQMMTDTVRTVLGFEHVEGKPSIQEALQHLEVDHAEWLIVPLMAEQPVNALHLLKLVTEHGELKHTRVSLLLEEEERYVLPQAFELGMFSYHTKPFTKDTLTEELKSLFAVLEANGNNEPRVAAHYLRAFLKGKKAYSGLVELEKNLLDLFPGHPQTLFNLAEPQYHVGQKDLAKKTLSQVKLLDAKLGEKADELFKALFPDQQMPALDGSGGINVLGANNVVVIESDDATGRGIEDTLKKLGCPKVTRHPDGETAWAAMSAGPEPDLIITEWRVPKLSGPMLIQRLRHHGFLTVPIVVLSSLLKPDDMPFVREIGIANIIQKPLNKDLFVPGLIWTMQQERQPTEQQALERKIRQLLKANKKDDVEPLKAQLLSDAQVPLSRKRLVEAEVAFAHGNYPLARDAAVEALKLAGDGIHVLNILGKAFMRLSAFEAALKCFKKAQEMSPHNLERLCLIAESETELGDHVAAQDAIADARSLDPDAKVVKEAEVRVAITKGDTSGAKKLLAGFDSIDGIIAYMNNKAVAMAKCGQANEAIGVYKKTLESVPDNQPDPKAIVLYNLALAQLRDNELDAAASRLADVVKFKQSRVAKRAANLLQRIKTAKEKGQDFKLKSSDAAPDAATPAAASAASAAAPGGGEADATKLSTDDDQRRLLAMVLARRGDICCYMIFHSPDAADPRTTALLAKAPRYQPREAIARDEAMGAERLAKSS